MIARTAVEEDLAFLIEIEKRFHNEGFIGHDTREAHVSRMGEVDSMYLIFEQDGRAIGYAILRGLESPHNSIELKRIAVAEPGLGVGRAALETVLGIAFGELRAHRLWLDVFVDNERARRAYRSLGFVEEGVQRESSLRRGSYRSQVLMSMLEPEYRARVSESKTVAARRPH